jgi:hypothetical protein
VDIKMQVIKIFAYICFGFSALGLMLALIDNSFFIAHALVMFITGVLLMALDKIISTLVEIRDALLGSNPLVLEQEIAVVGMVDADARPARSLQELSADLEKLRQRL